MHRRMRIITVVATATLAALVFSGCADPTGSAGNGAAGSQDQINIFQYQKPTAVFSPLAPNSGPDEQVMTLIYDSLLVPSPDAEFVPAAAKALPEVTDGGKTITYTLKDDLAWSDGKPLTSADLVFTFTRAADPRWQSSKSTYLSTVVGLQDYVDGKTETIAGFEAPDPKTFVIRQTVEAPAMVGQVSTIGIMPEHVLKDLPVENFPSNDWFRKPTVTSGPFTFVEYKTDQYVKVTANPKFREKVGVQDVFLKPLTNSVATSQLSTGEMDIVQISAADTETVEGFSGVSVVKKKSTNEVAISWNQTQERFKDPRVRQAFLYGVDRAGIVKSALKGAGTVPNSIWPEKWAGSDLPVYNYDPAKAKQLLQEANFDFSKPVTLSWIAGGNADRDAAAATIQNQLSEIGVNLKLNQVQATWFADAYKNHTFDLTLYGGLDYGLIPANAGNVTNCKMAVPTGPNTGSYCNPELDTAIATALKETDDAGMKKAYEAAAKIENQDPAVMWLYSPDWVFGVSDRVQNFQVIDQSKWFEPWRWSVKKG